jgi:hypothetical protein
VRMTFDGYCMPTLEPDHADSVVSAVMVSDSAPMPPVAWAGFTPTVLSDHDDSEHR